MAFSPSDGACQKATLACPCGYRGHPTRECACTPPAVDKYIGKLSGPLLDRIDLRVEVGPVAFGEWSGAGAAEEPSTAVLARVSAARAVQAARWPSAAFALNAFAAAAELKALCAPADGALEALEAAANRFCLSARSLDRALKVARTIADLAGAARVEAVHVKEALLYRGLDRARAVPNGEKT